MSDDQHAGRWLDEEVLVSYAPAARDLWALRPDVAAYADSSFRAIFRSDDTSHVSQGDRLLAAETAARASASSALADAYGRELAAQTPHPERGPVVAEFAERLAVEPVRITAADYDALRGVGLSEQALVTLTLLVGFVTYQVRALAGLEVVAGAR